MNGDLLAEVLKLSPSDRLELIEALWDTLGCRPLPPPTDEEVGGVSH